MRIMLYGMQNSGATLVALFVGQRANSLMIPDLWTMYRAPRLTSAGDACIKVPVTTSFPLEQHIEAFTPDHVFLVVRRPVDNILSLRRKSFARHDGTPVEKLAITDGHFQDQRPFSGVIVFEDFVRRPSTLSDLLADVGWEVPGDAENFRRTPLEMERHIWQTAPELYSQVQWGTGQARVQPLSSITLGAVEDDEAAQLCQTHCPHLHEYYEKRRHEDGQLPDTVTLRHAVQDEAALQGHANFVANQLALFESLVQVGDLDAALELAVELCAVAPDVPGTWNAQARALDTCGRSDEAEAILLQALDASDPGSTLHIGLSIALASHALRSGDVPRAVDVATAVAEHDAGRAQGHQVLGDCALRELRFDDAQRHARTVLEIDPRSANAMRVMADALFGAGLPAQACDWLRNCLAVAPDFQVARRKLVQYSATTGTPNAP